MYSGPCLKGCQRDTTLCSAYYIGKGKETKETSIYMYVYIYIIYMYIFIYNLYTYIKQSYIICDICRSKDSDWG